MDLEIDILPSGHIRIARGDMEKNAALVSFLSEVYTDDELSQLRDFLSGDKYKDST